MKTVKVLFVCIHNSARSQMAESFLNLLGNGDFIALSAGIEPGELNPIVIQAMGETGIDISNNRTKSVDAFLHSKSNFDYVITVCDETNAERCPVFPGNVSRLHWGFRDPSSFTGTIEEKLIQTRIVRDEIRGKIQNWIITTDFIKGN